MSICYKSFRSMSWITTPLLLLFAVSQLGMLAKDGDTHGMIYSGLIFPVYVLLLCCWQYTVHTRVTNPYIKKLFYGEIGIMLIWLTVRVLQKTVLRENDILLRRSGYLLVIPVVMCTLLGFYASMYIGRSEAFKLPGRYYILFLAAGVLIVLTLTTESHGFVIKPYSGGSAVRFKAGFGMVLLVMWALVLKVLQIVNVAFYNGKNRRLRLMIVPVGFMISMFAAAAIYVLSDFVVPWEPMEFSALLFFIEYAGWESCIKLGLYPVNTEYEKVFNLSAAAMQILSSGGEPQVRSETASELSGEDFQRLMESDTHSFEDRARHRVVKLSPICDGYVVFEADLSELHSAAEKLADSNEQLIKESELLQRDIKLAAEKAAINEKNRLYNQLSQEVSGQLELINGFLDRCSAETAGRMSLYRKICLVGVYIKRRSNQRLGMVVSDRADSSELNFCLHDMFNILSSAGTKVRYSDDYRRELWADHLIFLFDLTERVFEYADFEMTSVDISLREDMSFAVTVECSPEKLSGELCISGMPELYPAEICTEGGRVTAAVLPERSEGK